MTDVFFSYSSQDRERVRPIYEALTALDFDVFWDQQVPAGTDWDTWIKEKLASARSAVVFWSLNSIGSDNVRHEATVAKTQGKLVPILLDPLRVDQFPMGLFNTQAARLMDWTGNGEDAEWRKLVSELQAKAMPAWVARQLALREEEVGAERKKREAAQARGDAAHAQLEKEIAGFDDLRRAREAALVEAEKARAELAGLKEALEAAKTQNEDLSGRLAAVERMGAAHRGGVPMWGLVLGLMGAAGLGAGGLYVFHAAPMKAVMEADSSRATTALETELSRTKAAERKLKEAEARIESHKQSIEYWKYEAASAERKLTDEFSRQVAAARAARRAIPGEIDRVCKSYTFVGACQADPDCQFIDSKCQPR